MLSIGARNVNEALRSAMLHFRMGCKRIISPRGLRTIELCQPVCTTYLRPTERVLTIKERDANPFFHFFEALWMLNGNQDVEWVSKFNSNIATYSDDGIKFHAAYGHRWRNHFGIDQIMCIINMLRTDSDTRQAVLQIWDAKVDLNTDSKDIPCNDIVFFKVRNDALHMTVCCRSNDAIWGCYGTNAVHFSMLQEVIAAEVGVNVGHYRQVSDSLHIYTNSPLWEPMENLPLVGACPYIDDVVKPFPMVTDVGTWFTDLQMFMANARKSAAHARACPYRNPFFEYVAYPMLLCWERHKENGAGLQHTHLIAATDWRLACHEWFERRET